MMLAAAWTALLLLSPGAAPIAGAHALVDALQPASAPASAKDERATQAADYYSKGRYVEASLEFEGLWRDFPAEPRFLFNAAASRYIAGHYAHTVAYLDEYLARKDVQGDDRKEAQAQRDEARNKVAAVSVEVTLPPGAAEVTVVVKHVARGASDLRPELLFPARVQAGRAKVVVQLEPGSWVVGARSPGHEAAEQRAEVTRDPGQRVALALRVAAAAPTPEGPGPVDNKEVPPATARALKIGVSASAGALIVGGVAVLAAGAAKRGGDGTCDRPEDNFLACKQDLAADLRMRDAGAGLLGAGVGVLAGGLTWIARDAKTRRKAWTAQAILGGLAIAGGAAWLSTSSIAFNRANNGFVADWGEYYGGRNAVGHAASASVFGLGVGLVAGSALGLALQRKFLGRSPSLRSLRLDPAAGQGRAGLTISGRF